MKRLIRILFVLLFLANSLLVYSESSISFSNDQHNELKWLISNNFSDDTLLLMDSYADKLIESYPPESHMLLVLGSQNLILSAALHSKVGKEFFDDYVQVAPLSRLSDYLKHKRQDKVDIFLSRIIPEHEKLNSRKLIIVRLLQSGLNMEEVSGRVKGYLDEQGINSGFDFYFSCGKESIEEYFLPLQEVVTIRFNENYSEGCSFNENIEDTFKYNYFSPIYLDKLKKDFFSDWKGWVINPSFKYLLDFYKEKIRSLSK